jgi:EAL domain-containing protein (putative c-di-GMP-specific phosphodiesterase class I)/GGDEF domain-containing protein
VTPAVTHVHGRIAFLEKLESFTKRLQRREMTGPASLLLGEVDGFDLLTDWYGYRELDSLQRRMLAELAVRLRELSALHSGSAILGSCSTGGFAIALFGELATAAVSIAEGLWANLRDICILDVQAHRISCSLGCARPEASPDCDQLVAVARAALRQAIDLGGNRIEVGQHKGMVAHARQRILGRDLQRATSQKQFRLEYQPIVSLQNMSVEGVEALLRWNHPVLGAVSPAEFIPIAAQTGCLGMLGEWALENACREFVHMRSHPRLQDLRFVSVNVSRHSLGDRNLGRKVLAALSAAAMEPGQLNLEVTESELGRNPAAAMTNVRAIRSLGVTLAIDDFGVGYSSLASLHQFPVDMLKLDRSFLMRDFTSSRGTGTLAVAHAIINLARNEDVRVVAEGVETAEQLAQLQSMACPLAQGYHLCPPMSAADLPRYRLEPVQSGGHGS